MTFTFSSLSNNNFELNGCLSNLSLPRPVYAELLLSSSTFKSNMVISEKTDQQFQKFWKISKKLLVIYTNNSRSP